MDDSESSKSAALVFEVEDQVEEDEEANEEEKENSQKNENGSNGSRSTHRSDSMPSTYDMDSQNEEDSRLTTSRDRYSKQRSHHVAFQESGAVSLQLDDPSAEGKPANLFVKLSGLSGFNLRGSHGEADEFRFSSLFDEATLIPDISIMCRMCRLHINIEELREHKTYHDTLAQLGFKQLPGDEAELLAKRKQLQSALYAKYMRKSKDLNGNKVFIWHAKIKQLNFAFELIRSYLNNSYETNRRYENKNLYTDVYSKAGWASVDTAK